MLLKCIPVPCAAVLALAGGVTAAYSATVPTPDTAITLTGRSISVQGSGAVASGNRVTINRSGTFNVSGKLDDGQLIVDTPDKALVRVVLNNASITSTSAAPIEIRTAELVEIALPAGSSSVVAGGPPLGATSGATDRPNAAIYSREDLSIDGPGALQVRATQHGINSRDDLKILGGNLRITAGNDGLKANDELRISGGDVTINAGGDGLQADKQLSVRGGTLVVEARDDAINCDGELTISGGVLRLAAGNDGIHSDGKLTVAGGDVQLSRSFEGLEGAVIVISGGRVQLVSSDDGVNVANDRFGAETYMAIRGGTLIIDAAGDGLDSSNSPVEMSGGTVIVHGPTMRGNGPIDYDHSFRVTGGLLLAAGSASMSQAPSPSSTQNSVRVNLPTMHPGNTPVRIATASGEPVLEFTPAKAYQSLVVSSPKLRQNETYVVYLGGADGGGGTEAARFTVSSAVTAVGSGGERGGRRR